MKLCDNPKCLHHKETEYDPESFSFCYNGKKIDYTRHKHLMFCKAKDKLKYFMFCESCHNAIRFYKDKHFLMEILDRK